MKNSIREWCYKKGFIKKENFNASPLFHVIKNTGGAFIKSINVENPYISPHSFIWGGKEIDIHFVISKHCLGDDVCGYDVCPDDSHLKNNDSYLHIFYAQEMQSYKINNVMELESLISNFFNDFFAEKKIRYQAKRKLLKSNICYVYLMKCFYEKPKFKIGISYLPERRLIGVKTSNPFLVELMAIYPAKSRENALDIEKALHFYYKDKKTNGEWFSLTDSDCDFLVNYLFCSYRFLVDAWVNDVVNIKGVEVDDKIIAAVNSAIKAVGKRIAKEKQFYI